MVKEKKEENKKGEGEREAGEFFLGSSDKI
jgi:hypothetical protein